MQKIIIRAAYAVTLSLLVAQLLVSAAQENQQARLPNFPDPAFARFEDNPDLPRVLLIGDAVSIGYTVPTQELLAGKANVHRIPVNGGTSVRGLEHLEKWLGKSKWDVIHFNWGLQDLRIQPHGSHQVALDEYQLNLEELVKRMEKSEAKLIWASTTPVPNAKLNPPRQNSDVLRYNEAAKKVMLDHDVMIDDLYALAYPRLEKLQNQDDVHFSPSGSRVLAEEVSARILAALDKTQETPEN